MGDARPTWECYRLPIVTDAGGWREVIEQKLQSAECPYHHDVVRGAIRVWDPEQPVVRVPASDLTCRNGYRLERVYFGKRRGETLVGVSLVRLVFEPGSTAPSPLSAADLFTKGRYPTALRHEQLIAGIERLIAFLNQGPARVRLQRHVEYAAESHAGYVTYRFGDHSTELAEVVSAAGLPRNLLGLVRSCAAATAAPIHLGVLSCTVRAPRAAMRIGEEAVRVLADWGCRALLSDLGTGGGIDAFLADGTYGQSVVLVPLEGTKGDRPSDSAMAWLRRLHSEKAAFQLCSTASNPRYSRHGLAMAILGKAGGAAFVVEPAGFPGFRDTWFIGLDLGRGGLNRGKVVAIALTAPTGYLRAYWRARKDEDETLRPEALREGLTWIASEAESLAPGRPLIMLRDGTRPHHESLASYRQALVGHDLTLIEYAKSGSPLIHQNPSEPLPGALILPAASDFAGLYPCTSPQREILTTPVKFRSPINPHNYSLSALARLLTALCHSATLSYQPSRLPAPIQWANGLARLSYTDLQFSGWSHRATRLVNLGR